MRPKEGFKVRRMLVSPGDLVIKIKSNRFRCMSSAATDERRVYSDDDADVNRIATADDLAYLKNPIWWTGMITSESRQAAAFAKPGGGDRGREALDLELISGSCVSLCLGS
jgi:hypothetical protein